ncbi:MAG: SMP-30/gluconolactonase/LRE family protein [Thermoguttaceae bacterium]
MNDMKNFFVLLFVALIALFGTRPFVKAAESVLAPNAAIEKLAENFGFTEGPAVDSKGNVYFVDDPKSKIYCWSIDDKKISVFVEESQNANGMFFDADDNLIVCEGKTGSIVSYNKDGKRTVLADKFDGKRFNKPNDLWIDPKGGIYFTDPVYGKNYSAIQDGEHVYYILPDRSNVLKVVNDMIKPNGLIGTPNGKTLYITDQVAGKVWKYQIQADGTLSEKTLFAPIGVDGMTIDDRGNVYITEKEVIIYNSDGNEIERIAFPETPANVCFGGSDRRTLFVTARTGFYSVPMKVQGVSPFAKK